MGSGPTFHLRRKMLPSVGRLDMLVHGLRLEDKLVKVSGCRMEAWQEARRSAGLAKELLAQRADWDWMTAERLQQAEEACHLDPQHWEKTSDSERARLAFDCSKTEHYLSAHYGTIEDLVQEHNLDECWAHFGVAVWEEDLQEWARH